MRRFQWLRAAEFTRVHARFTQVHAKFMKVRGKSTATESRWVR